MSFTRHVSFNPVVTIHARDSNRDQAAQTDQAAPKFAHPETRSVAEQVQSQDQQTPPNPITSESDRANKIIAAERNYERLTREMALLIEIRHSVFVVLCSKLPGNATEADRENCAAEAIAKYAEDTAELSAKILAAYSVFYQASKGDWKLPPRKIIPPVSNALPETEVSRLSQAVQECKEEIRTLKKEHHDFTVAFNTSYDEVMATYNHKKTGRRTRNKLSRDMESRRDAYRKVQEQFDMTHRQLSFDLGELLMKWWRAWWN